MELRLGIDIGSTTVKVVLINKDNNEVLFSDYKRHNAYQAKTTKELLKLALPYAKDNIVKIAICGSGGKPVATAIKVPFIQEVVANAKAIEIMYPNTKTAIELGGQDAKVLFFQYDENIKSPVASDMRMNGCCAGGTGAFIDEIATLLNVKTQDFESLAKEGKMVYDISGRCGVFAKTDIQPLLASGARIEDIALSTFHAIAKQTIGGLSQGLELKAPIIFEGGPLTFNPTLVKVFGERLNLKEDDIIIPEHPETIVARGTALAIDSLFKNENYLTIDEAIKRLEDNYNLNVEESKEVKPYFLTLEDKNEFFTRHNGELKEICKIPSCEIIRGYIGLDSGSTTSKFVLIDENENVIYRYYENNHGDPIKIVKNGIIKMEDYFKSLGKKLEILGFGTTGYGEMLFNTAFNADYHIVETVAHAEACKKYKENVSFVLDIGGQDMKAIWVSNGVVTNILLNEACSSGCGSFLENFADGLNIKVEDIASSAFSSTNPAHLGSRCTVFMTSTIINEQRNGHTSPDIMAGLCRSIIENVFTKVVRISNTKELGDNIVVQGGTFRNFAVLRAIEEYLGKNVTLAPYPGEMGAIGAAILTKRDIKKNGYKNGLNSSFIGLDVIRNFTYQKEFGYKCPKCQNHCSLTITTFSTGQKWVTGNRCERGASLDKEVKLSKAFDMYTYRFNGLFKMYDITPVRANQNKIIGLPRTLEFWDSMPFWTSFFRILGYDVKLSSTSSNNLYEDGIRFVASDTICFPAKLVHGHIESLAKMGVDKIFMPFIMHMPPEGVDKKSPYVCSILMGYPMVVKNFEDPVRRYNIEFDTPVFHWFNKKNRHNQIVKYAMEILGASKKEADEAYKAALDILMNFKNDLKTKAQEIIDDAKKNNTFAVVLAGRPYHNDPFISHNLSKQFTSFGIPVLTVDSLPNLEKVDLKRARVEITNNFHTRMLAASVIAATTKELEYVQIVSFGCGHDAILSDEIVRIMTEAGEKPPLIVKVDESAATGALSIRVKSFIQTVKIRRGLVEPKLYDDDIKYNTNIVLQDPYPAKFLKSDKKKRTILLPNLSPDTAKFLEAIMAKGGFIPKILPCGGKKQVQIGKKYAHNDICFPCQMVIGELIDELQKGNYNHDEVAVGMIKFQCDCRMSHYAALLRKGLDAAGFSDVPIITTDGSDSKDMHSHIIMFNIQTVFEAIWGFIMLDIMNDIRRKIRPYEINKGETDRVFYECVDNIALGLRKGLHKAIDAYKDSIHKLNEIKYDRSHLKPLVFVTGEILVTYHPGTNCNLERYLEDNGMEVIFPRVTHQLRKDFLATGEEIKNFDAPIFNYPAIVTKLFNIAQKSMEKIAKEHALFEESLKPNQIHENVKDIIPLTLSCGEGWLMTAEIAYYAMHDVKSFIILQPFGCLPNHITGKGVTKKLKEKYPGIQILPLDLDPDTSFANIENRLQMLIMNNQKR